MDGIAMTTIRVIRGPAGRRVDLSTAVRAAAAAASPELNAAFVGFVQSYFAHMRQVAHYLSMAAKAAAKATRRQTPATTPSTRASSPTKGGADPRRPGFDSNDTPAGLAAGRDDEPYGDLRDMWAELDEFCNVTAVGQLSRGCVRAGLQLCYGGYSDPTRLTNVLWPIAHKNLAGDLMEYLPTINALQQVMVVGNEFAAIPLAFSPFSPSSPPSSPRGGGELATAVSRRLLPQPQPQQQPEERRVRLGASSSPTAMKKLTGVVSSCSSSVSAVGSLPQLLASVSSSSPLIESSGGESKKVQPQHPTEEELAEEPLVEEEHCVDSSILSSLGSGRRTAALTRPPSKEHKCGWRRPEARGGVKMNVNVNGEEDIIESSEGEEEKEEGGGEGSAATGRRIDCAVKPIASTSHH
eukprot:GHVU01206204.1.p1 GENE.GHVU01206204.1~~GHVU01206204.1.p1  ORF type:complete len:410 (-),score=89.59 GHVU01206204.1:229-1458(-)